MNNVMGLVAQPLLLLSLMQSTPTIFFSPLSFLSFSFRSVAAWIICLISFFLSWDIFGRKKKLVDRWKFAQRSNNKFARAPTIFVSYFKMWRYIEKWISFFICNRFFVCMLEYLFFILLMVSNMSNRIMGLCWIMKELWWYLQKETRLKSAN